MPTGERLGPMDATLLYLETATSTSNIGIVFRFDAAIPFDDFVRDLECRRIPYLPRFRQVVAPVPFNLSFPTWENDPSFDLKQHVHQHELANPGTEQELDHAIAQVMARRIDLTRSPWEMTLVHGLEDGGSAIILHMHHCITDGAGLPKLLDTLFDPEPLPFATEPEGAPPTPAAPLPGAWARLAAVFRDRRTRRIERKRRAAETPAESQAEKAQRKAKDKQRLKDFGEVMKEFFQAPGVRLPFNAPLSGRIHYGRTSFPLADIRRIADISDGTLNDVLLALLGGAIDQLANELDIDVEEKMLRVYQAANTRTIEEQNDWGNRLAFMPALVPLGLTDSGERCRRITAYTKRMKALGVREIADKMVRGFQSVLPPVMAKLGLRLMLAPIFQKLGSFSRRPPGFNIYLTNARFPNFNSFLGGRKMTAMSAFGPLVPNTGVTCTAINFADLLYIGIAADPESLPDVDGFASKFQTTFNALIDTTPQDAHANHETS